MKNFLVIILSSILVLNFTGVSLATNSEGDLENSISYNIEKGGTQEFQLINSEGEETTVVIEEVEEGRQGRAVRNGTYNIYKKVSGKWEAGYQIVVRGNNIVAAKNPYCRVYSGRFVSSYLYRTSLKQATYNIRRETGSKIINDYLKAKISTNSISISL